MIDLTDIFQYKKININKATNFGFVEDKKDFTYQQTLPNNPFKMTITINKKNQSVDYFLTDLLTNEDYPLIKVENANGKYVSELRHACSDILANIAETCYDVSPFKLEQSLKIIQLIEENFQVELEFPWKKLGSNAVFRHSTNQKWFAAILSVDYSKIDPSKKGPIEVINLKEVPEKIESLIDNKTYFPAYHMNKKHWYSIILDGSLDDSEIFEKINISFDLTKLS